MIGRLPALKDAHRERRLFQQRVLVASIGMLLLVLAVLARLVWLQIVNHDHYTTLSQENRLKVVPLAPPRGLIYSRDGVLLADNRPSFSLAVVPENAGDIGSSVRELGEILDISDDELEHARAVVRAFADNPDAGTLQIDGKMIDRPHLVQAERILAFGEALAARG